MTATHRSRVEATLAEAAARHVALLERLSPEMRASLPVDAQGLTGAIDFVVFLAKNQFYLDYTRERTPGMVFTDIKDVKHKTAV